MDYLNKDNPLFRSSPQQLDFAVDELLRLAMQSSHSFRLEVDSVRLRYVIGAETFSKLLPDYPMTESCPKASSSQYEVYEDILDEIKSAILEQILSLTPKGYRERPLNYIQSIRLLDREGRTILRGGDQMDFILFDLPGPQRGALLETYLKHDIPSSVIEQVNIDVNKLEP